MKNIYSLNNNDIGKKIISDIIVIKRIDLLKFCAGCGDYTATHWNERIARSVGLPDVIAHGTLLASLAVKTLTDWLKDPTLLIGYTIGRFTHPVPVPDDDIGSSLTIAGFLSEINMGEKAIFRLKAMHEGKNIFVGGRAFVSLVHQ